MIIGLFRDRLLRGPLLMAYVSLFSLIWGNNLYNIAITFVTYFAAAHLAHVALELLEGDLAGLVLADRFQ